jgi:hypothetical protein
VSALHTQPLGVEPLSIAGAHSPLLSRFVEQVCRTSRCALSAAATNDTALDAE